GFTPGTGLARQYGRVMRFLFGSVGPTLVPLMKLFIHVQTVPQAGAALARLAIDADQDRVTGVYYAGRRQIRSSDASYQRHTQGALLAATGGPVALGPAEAAVTVARLG